MAVRTYDPNMSSMTILEKVARAVKSEAFDRFDTSTLVALVITAFLAAAAEEGWHMQRDEATEEMITAGGNHDHVGDGYEAMHNAAPKFEWGK